MERMSSLVRAFAVLVLMLAAVAPATAGETASSRVLVVLSSVEQLAGTPSPTGNYLREVALPVSMFEAAGLAVDVVSPRGGATLVRGNVAYGMADDVTGHPVLSAFAAQRLRDDRMAALSPDRIDAAHYRAVFFAGTLGALVDLASDAVIASIAADVHRRGGVVAFSGHGIAALPAIIGADGKVLVAGRRVAAFKRSEDVAFFEAHLGWRDVLPYHVEDRLREAGAVIASGEDYGVVVVEDDRILTGQNAASVEALAAKVIERIAARP
jgi:putative intracellular protease/amidase